VLGVLLREIQKIIAHYSHNCSKKFVLGTTQYLCGYWCVPFRFVGQVNIRELLSTQIIKEEESRIKAMWTKCYQDCRKAL
jgi:hypothetical protein